MAVYELPDGSKYELDLTNPEHKAWLEQKAKAAPQVQKPEGNDSISRQLGLTARAGVKGIAGLGGLVVDPITAGINAVSGAKIPTTVSSAETVMDRLGVPSPQTGSERIVGDMAGALAGTGGLAKGAELVSKGASPLVQAITQFLQQAPKTQVAASAASSGASSGIKESGGGPGAQVAAALVGGAVPGTVAGLAEPVKRVGSHLVEPLTQSGRDVVKSRLLRDIAGDKLDDLSRAMQTQPKVQGMQYNAALAAEDVGAPEFVALAEALSKRVPRQTQAIAEQNTAARLGEVRKIAGSEADLGWAKDLRSSTAAMTYPEAFNTKIAGDPALARLFQNPFIRKAAMEAEDLSRAQKINPKEDLTKYLHNVKFGLDKMLARKGDTALGSAEQREALKVQKDLIAWLEEKNPAYQTARVNFAEQSRPINRMEVGKFLEQKLTAPLDDSERAGVFAQAMRDAPRTLKQATGNPRYEEIAQVLLPKQVRALDNVESELARLRGVKQQASLGADRAKDVVGTAFEPIEPPSFLNRGVTLLRAALERSQRGTSKKTLEELAEEMQSPEKVRRLLTEVKPAERLSLLEALKQYLAGSATGATVGESATRGN